MTTDRPTISVVMPVFNVARFVEEALESLVNQTYTDIEIIVIDDCSSDETLSLVQGMSMKDDRIVVLRNDVNSGISFSLNQGIKVARGVYIVRMDGDDVSRLDRIEVLYGYICRNPQFDLVGSSYEGIDEAGRSLGVRQALVDPEAIDRTLLFANPVSHIWIAKKEVYDVLGGYRADTVEDYDFILRIKSSGFKFTNVSEPLYKVRLRAGNTASSQGLRQEKAFRYVVNLYKERLRYGRDSYSVTGFKEATNSSKAGLAMHQFSQKALNRAVLTNSKVSKVFYVFLSFISSYYMSMYILRRVMLRLMS